MITHLRRLRRREHSFQLMVRSRASAGEVALAESVIDRSGVAPLLEQELEASRINGSGRPRELSVRTLLVALLLLATAGHALHLRRVVELLNNLDTPVRRRLGVDRPGGSRITERQVQHLFARLRHLLDPTTGSGQLATDEQGLARAQQLRNVCDLLLAGTLPESRNSGSYALDATTIAAWARGSRSQQNWRDPDAGWAVKGGSGSTNLDVDGGTSRPRKSKAVFGYDLHLLSWTRDDGQDEAAPALVERVLLFGGGRTDIDLVTSMIVDTVTNPVADQPTGDLVCDRWYTQQSAGRFAMPLRKAGLQLVMDQRKNQSGPRGTYRGALVVDGDLYCPAMPSRLHQLPTADFRNDAQMQARAQVAETREPWRMQALTAPDADGFQRMQCGAEGRGCLACPVKPKSLAKPAGKSLPVIAPPAAPGDFCTQNSVTVPPSARGSTAQKHPWGSHAWRRSYDRRNVVEGSAGILRNAGGSDMKRDHIRVMGLAANSLLLTIAVAGMNLRLLATHLEREDEAQAAASAPSRPGGFDAIIERDLPTTPTAASVEEPAPTRLLPDPGQPHCGGAGRRGTDLPERRSKPHQARTRPL